MSESSKKVEPDPGIFVTKGMKISIPSFSISIGDNGELVSDPITLFMGLDMSPYWLEIAYQHLLATEAAHVDLMAAKEARDDEQIAAALQKEFVSGMQAIMASGVAIDAYYASVKDHIELPEDLMKAWRENGTARYKQIAEVLKRAFPMSQESAKHLRDILEQNLKFRDKAVHPKYGTTAPLLHIELNKVSDWRYAVFRFYNAKAIVGLTLSIIYQTASKPFTDKHDRLRSYCEELIVNIDPILNVWVQRYGKLF